MKPLCPRCHSETIVSQHTAQRITGTLGFITCLLARPSPLGMGIPLIFTHLPSALLTRLTNACIGAQAGSVIGESIDRHLLCNWACLSCSLTFFTPYYPDQNPGLESGDIDHG